MYSNGLYDVVNGMGIALWATFSISLFVIAMLVTFYLEEKAKRETKDRRDIVEKEKHEVFLRLYELAEQGEKASEETLGLLHKMVEECYPGFSHKIHSLCNLSINDMRLCMLVRLGFTSRQIASLLVMEPNTVYHAKGRIYHRLARKSGKSKDLDALLSAL